MASTIRVHVIDEHGNHLSQMQFNIDFGSETQDVVIVLSDPDSDCEHGKSYREALNDSMAEQLAMVEGYDA